MNRNPKDYVASLCASLKEASYQIAPLPSSRKNSILERIASLLKECKKDILAANAEDVASASENGLAPTMVDRLRLSEGRIDAMAASLRELILLPDPVGSGEVTVRPNGLRIAHIRAPLGCVGIIYEARPNVTIDAGALCLKTGNAVLLRGGKEALQSNKTLVSLMRKALTAEGVDPNAVCLVEQTEREYAYEMMQARDWLDVLIPRGGAGLIKSVVEKATVPVIETGAGNCHMLIASDADLEMAVRLALSAKISRPSVCNALEKLLVMRDIAPVFLPRFASEAKTAGVELRGDEGVLSILPDVLPMTEDDLRREYNDMILSIMLTDSLDDAVRHINRYSTHHSEAIITSSLENAAYFQAHVDSAAVYVNASTRFTDGGEFGLGAEIGISTQKLHARGPMGMLALTTDKYLVNGNGQTR